MRSRSAPRRRGGRDLTRGPVGELLFALSWPMTIGLFSVIAFNVVDTLYIGRLGPQPLAAMGYSFPVIFSVSSVAIGLGAGAGALASRAIGAGDRERARRLATNALILATLIVGLMTILGSMTIEPLFRHVLGAPPEIVPYIKDYMHIWYAGMAFLVVPMVGNSVLRADGESISPSAMMVIAALLNAALSPVMIFGFFGFPRLEMEGAALASALARGSMFFGALALLHYRGRLIDWSGASLKTFMSDARETIRIGGLAAISNAVQPLSSIAITRLLSGYGPDVVAGFAVGARIEAIFLIPFFALQTGLGPFVGQNAGAGEGDRLETARRRAVWFVVGWAAFAFVLLAFAGPTAATWFTDDPEISRLSARYLLFVSAGFIGAGLLLSSTATLNPLNKPMLALSATLLRFVGVYLPFGLLFSRLAGPEGVFAAAGLSYVVAGAAAFLIVRWATDRAVKSAGSARAASGAAKPA